MGLFDRLGSVWGSVDARLEPLRRTVAWRAYGRYSVVRGNVLAGGVAYFAFFSIFPAMALGFTAFGLLLGGQEDLQVKLVQYVNSNLGSAVISYRSTGGGIVSVEQLTQAGVLGTAGVVGLVTLVLTGLGWIAALRDGVQAVFAAHSDTNFVVLKLVDLVLLAVAGVAVLTSVVASVAVNVATGQVLDSLGIPSGTLTAWAVNIATQLVLVVVDAVIFTLLFDRLAGVDVPVQDVAAGGLIASLGFTVLKLFASVLLRTVSHNRFLAAFGVLVGLLVWMNLVARVTLVAAAWGATVAADRGHLDTPDPGTLVGVQAPAQQEALHTRPGPVPASRGGGGALLAGLVAGAALTTATRAAWRARRRPR